MVLASICQVLSSRLELFANGVRTARVGFIPKSITSDADTILNETYGIRIHRLEIRATGTPADFNELVTRIEAEPHDVPALVESHGFEGNTKYAFFSNAKSFAKVFRVPEDVLRAAVGAVREVEPNEKRYVALGSVVRTLREPRRPGVLLARTWHGRVPGVQLIPVTPRTANDTAGTPVMDYNAEHNISVSMYPRAIFHLDELVARGAETLWNAFSVTCARTNDGRTANFTFHIPAVSFSADYDYDALHTAVINAFDTMPIA